jgi:hypothetical protein
MFSIEKIFNTDIEKSKEISKLRFTFLSKVVMILKLMLI